MGKIAIFVFTYVLKTMKLFRLTILLCLPLLASVFATAQSRNITVENGTFRSGGMERSYILHLPSGLPEGAPLVFVLHGYNCLADPREYDMDSVAVRYGFAVCYPVGAKDLRGNSCWNVGYPFQDGLKTDDVGFLCELARHLQKEHHLSSKNTFCTGISNGGEMCYLLAYCGQDVFSAVAPVAGLTLESTYRQFGCPRPIPLFEIHGTQDSISEWTGDLEDEGGWGAYLPVPIAAGYWVAANRCTQEKTDTLPRKGENGRVVVAHMYAGGTAGAEVWLYEIRGGTHSWGSSDLNTGEEIWKFFSKYIK